VCPYLTETEEKKVAPLHRAGGKNSKKKGKNPYLSFSKEGGKSQGRSRDGLFPRKNENCKKGKGRNPTRETVPQLTTNRKRGGGKNKMNLRPTLLLQEGKKLQKKKGKKKRARLPLRIAGQKRGSSTARFSPSRKKKDGIIRKKKKRKRGRFSSFPAQQGWGERSERCPVVASFPSKGGRKNRSGRKRKERTRFIYSRRRGEKEKRGMIFFIPS